MRLSWLVFLSFLFVLNPVSLAKNKFTGLRNALTISDLKEWKRLLKTRNNVLALFAEGQKIVSDFLATFEEVAGEVRGKGTLVFVDCSSDGKKMCKKLKTDRSHYSLKHYMGGSFHKDYDRLMEAKSIISFMENPRADPPWYEDPEGSSVKHLIGTRDLEVFLRTEKRPSLVMFYAPWCGHCKKMKPELAAAASEVKGKYVLAGMDVDTPDAFGVREQYNITGFPTIIFFEKGMKKYDYAGGRDKAGILEWLKDPHPPETAPTGSEGAGEEVWSEVESDVVHLTDATFDSVMSASPSSLVMFYAPWCGHCKAIKPAFAEAAKLMQEQGIPGSLVAVDATEETELGKRFSVSGYPTLRYFSEGLFQYDYGYGRTADDIVKFMKSPREPPPPEKEWAEEESAVTHLTDATFKPHLKKKKHALVMFYAPWCGHCKAAKPEYTAAAQLFVDNKKTSFTALDCTKFRSTCKQFGVSGFPTFKYFNYGKHDALYQGGRSADDFSRFMNNPSASLHSEL